MVLSLRVTASLWPGCNHHAGALAARVAAVKMAGGCQASMLFGLFLLLAETAMFHNEITLMLRLDTRKSNILE
ncbi:hypothetical protein chiPu_0001647 [Chiloscyllium punctatum]|uniref:Uncharacterized protein n=1 Tax=Chiloscyllium punctatum TaxID=137246 RepID=A0A401RYL3_CHIPU|nr:hypothetical protein [Chiloscyllium punctatum]